MDDNAINEQHIELYTRLLMGLINLASFTFPPHLYTSQLDIIARIPLWETGSDFPHGSGHGIGVFLNFYECKLFQRSVQMLRRSSLIFYIFSSSY